ncbi:MAG TPA: response regulator transcription factor [Solirubrobacteraceae bacterium]|jgi:DNA-binding NarL/FixJ family response regulator
MPPQTPITVVLARFEDLLAKGLHTLIEGDPSLAIVAADVEYRRLPVLLRAHAPDVAILDAGALLKLAEIRKLISSYPATSLVLIAKDPSTVECAQLLAFGASACLPRDTQSRDVLNAIHLASRGLQVVPRPAPDSASGSIVGGQLLTQREAEVLPLLRQGHTNTQIALALEVGIETVRTHARNIYRKLGVCSRRELLAPPAPEGEPLTVLSAKPLARRASVPLRARRGHGLRQR